LSKILITDDEAYISTQLKERLTMMGHEVVGRASSGESSIEMAKNLCPDLVLMDIVMPGKLDGIAAAEIIKKEQDIPVLFMTGYADDQLIERAKQVEPYGYILKPFQEKEIKASIEIALHKKEMERLLYKSEKKYRELVNNIPGVVFTGYKNWSIDFIDNKIEALTGHTMKDFNSRKLKWLDIIFKDDIEPMQKIFTKALKSDKTYIREYRITSKNGEKNWLQQRARIICDSQGEILSVTGILFDISNLKRMEKEKEKLEARLQQVQRMESIGTLAGGVAHEFNNILAIIIPNTELAIDDVPDRSLAKECLDEIRSASLRASNVVQQMLSFAHKDLTERQPVKLAPIIKDCLRLVQTSIPGTIEISQDLSCEFDTVLADPTRISQVIMNLCPNAAQAMSEHGGVLKVTLKNVEVENQDEELDVKPGRYVKLTVSDTGHGIQPEIIDRIFDPYFTTKEVGKGTGMGLSVVHGIVKNCRGTITVHSEPGKGSVFEVLLPVIEAETKQKVKEPEALPTGSERILFVDDEQSLVKVVRRILERLGYEVETKTNPDEALDLFRSGPDRFDLVITDMTMPQMTGKRLVKEILNIRADMPIILCTGFHEKISEENAGELGIKALVFKPFAARDFSITVRNVLDEK